MVCSAASKGIVILRRTQTSGYYELLLLVICVMAPPIHLGAWSMALMLWLPFELLLFIYYTCPPPSIGWYGYLWWEQGLPAGCNVTQMETVLSHSLSVVQYPVFSETEQSSLGLVSLKYKKSRWGMQPLVPLVFFIICHPYIPLHLDGLIPTSRR